MSFRTFSWTAFMSWTCSLTFSGWLSGDPEAAPCDRGLERSEVRGEASWRRPSCTFATWAETGNHYEESYITMFSSLNSLTGFPSPDCWVRLTSTLLRHCVTTMLASLIHLECTVNSSEREFLQDANNSFSFWEKLSFLFDKSREESKNTCEEYV